MPTVFKDGIISKNGVNMGVDVNPSGDPGVASALASQGRGIADQIIGATCRMVTLWLPLRICEFPDFSSHLYGA